MYIYLSLLELKHRALDQARKKGRERKGGLTTHLDPGPLCPISSSPTSSTSSISVSSDINFKPSDTLPLQQPLHPTHARRVRHLVLRVPPRAPQTGLELLPRRGPGLVRRVDVRAMPADPKFILAFFAFALGPLSVRLFVRGGRGGGGGESRGEEMDLCGRGRGWSGLVLLLLVRLECVWVGGGGEERGGFCEGGVEEGVEGWPLYLRAGGGGGGGVRVRGLRFCWF